MNTQELTELITKEVLKRMKTAQQSPLPNEKRILLIGSIQKVPLSIQTQYKCCNVDLQTFPEDLQDYEKLMITELSMTQLSDIAHCRDTEGASKAVLYSLLQEKEVLMLADAPYHRSFVKGIGKPIYNKLEEYVKNLENIGVLIYSKSIEMPSSKTRISPNEKVLTESIAIQYAKQKEAIVTVQKGTIVTPSAKDIFRQNQMELQFI